MTVPGSTHKVCTQSLTVKRLFQKTRAPAGPFHIRHLVLKFWLTWQSYPAVVRVFWLLPHSHAYVTVAFVGRLTIQFRYYSAEPLHCTVLCSVRHSTFNQSLFLLYHIEYRRSPLSPHQHRHDSLLPDPCFYSRYLIGCICLYFLYCVLVVAFCLWCRSSTSTTSHVAVVVLWRRGCSRRNSQWT